MRASKYLNFILTVNAVLLTALVWTQVAGRPMLAGDAVAQTRSRPTPPPTFTNAAAQRQEMIKALRDMQRSVDGATRALQSGKISVRVENLDDISINNN